MSGPDALKSLMPLGHAETFIEQFMDIPFASEYIVIGGGEAMAPYMFGENKYISNILSAIYKVDAVPTIKTNGTWGANQSLRQLILKDLADTAYFHQVLATLDISIDEFHNNIDGVANIISETIKSDYIAPAVRICLVGFNTVASAVALTQLRVALHNRGIATLPLQDDTNDFIVTNGNRGMQIFTSFNTPIYRMGRALITNTYTIGEPTGFADNDGNCLTVDNADTAILNYKFREKIAGRDLDTVLKKLKKQMHHHQH